MATQACAQALEKARLDSCIIYYENGEYTRAVDSIRVLLPLIGDKRDEATAYKYLGFSYVMLEMLNSAKEYFRVAIDKFPQMDVDTLDVPPNIVMVFRQVKLEKQMQKGEIVDKRIDQHIRRKNAVGTLFLCLGLGSLGTGGYFGYDSYKQYQEYQKINSSDQDQLDTHYNNHLRSLIIAASCGGAALITIPTAIIIFSHKIVPASQKKTTFRLNPNGFDIVYRF